MMCKIAVVYWSGTGNTETMARAVTEGAQADGAKVTLLTAKEFTPVIVDCYDAIAFGCPAMGAEVLEEDEFEPMFTACQPKLWDKRIALFGSYGWGSGEWMDAWKEDAEETGVNVIDSPIINEQPDDDGIAACHALGAQLA